MPIEDNNLEFFINSISSTNKVLSVIWGLETLFKFIPFPEYKNGKTTGTD